MALGKNEDYVTPEGKVKRDVKKYLDSIGAYHVWPVPTGYGPKLLDCYACIKGRFVVIETKAPGKMPTRAQSYEMERINKRGGIAFYADSVERCRRYIEDHVLGKYDPC